MPYKNIVFVKLEKRLLNDHRWFGMSDKAQLLYIKLMLGCAETYNKLPSNCLLLRQQLRITWKKKVFDLALKEVEQNFPKFKKSENYYYFEDFESKTNYIRDCPSVAQIPPKAGTDIDKEKDIDKEQEQEVNEPDTSSNISNEVTKLFIKRWSRNYKNFSELQGAEKLVLEFGIDKVNNAFRIAGEAGKDKDTIPYVRGILNKEKQNGIPKKRFGNSDIMNELYGQ